MNRKTKSRIRAVICCVFAFFVSLLLFFASLLFVANTTVLQEDYMKSSMEKSAYYEQLASEIRTQLQSYSDATGIDPQFFSDCVSESEVRLAVNGELDSLYTATASGVSVKQIQRNLYTKLLSYAQNKGITLNDDTEQALSYLAETCAEDYAAAVTIPFLSTFSSLLQRFEGLILKVLLVVLLVLAVLIAYFFFVNKWKHRAVRYTIYGLSGGFLMVLLVPVVVLLSGKISKIGIVNPSAYGFVTDYLNGIFHSMLIIAAVFAAAVALLAFLYAHLRRHSMK